MLLALLLAFGSIPVTAPGASAQTPTLEPAGIIRTTPFWNSDVSMQDGEGSAYVPEDRSLWLADDNADSIYEVNPRTGKLKRVIGPEAFRSTKRLGGGPRAGRARYGDFEAMSYDEANDALYLFSGPCCLREWPTVFRLTRARRDGLFRSRTWQPLDRDTDFTAAGWNSADGLTYVGQGANLRAYHYGTNMYDEPFQIPGLAGILGISFSRDGSLMYAVNHHEELVVVDWITKTIVPGWTFDVTPFKVRDSRGVERIGGRFYVLDGAARPGRRLEFAVFRFNVRE